MTEITYTLKESFEYALNGNNEKATFITLTAPNFKQIDKVTPIKQAFTRVAVKSAKEAVRESTPRPSKEGEVEESKITGSEIIAMMYASDVEMKSILLYAEQLFKSGVALVDGETNLTTPLMEKMTLDDFEGLLGDYMSNFIAPSLMDGP